MSRRNFLFLILVALLAGRIYGETLMVGPDETYSTISAAIAAANAGDMIRINSGTYEENLILDKRLILEGSDRPILRGTGTGSVITVMADGCEIRGVVIERSGGDLQAEDAGVLLRSNSNIVEDNELRDILFGVYLYHSAGDLIRGNRITGRPELESGERGAAIHLWDSADNRLEENEIQFARDGMYVQSSPRNYFRGNGVSHLRYGLHFMTSDDNTFEDNTFSDNVAGAAIMYSRGIVLRRNRFTHNRGFSSFGILFQDCRQCTIEDNLIANNATGIFLEAQQDSIFRGNTIAENDVALQVFSSSENNTFAQNNFIDNLSPLKLIGRKSAINWQTGDGGNFWSDYDGYDLDGDSIGDVPHKIQNIFEYLEGNFPRIRIYLNSPAAESVVLAEKSFPVLRGSNEFDSKPLMRPVKSGYPVSQVSSGDRHRWPLAGISGMMLFVTAITFRRGFAR